MTAAPKLLACPYCGREGVAGMSPPTCRQTDAYNPADRAFPMVRCDCGAQVWGDNWDHSGASAVAAWNRSADRESAGAVEPVAWRVDYASQHDPYVCGGHAFVNKWDADKDHAENLEAGHASWVTPLYLASPAHPLPESALRALVEAPVEVVDAMLDAWFEGESLSDADKLSCPEEVEDWRRRMRLALAQPELLKWLGRAER